MNAHQLRVGMRSVLRLYGSPSPLFLLLPVKCFCEENITTEKTVWF